MRATLTMKVDTDASAAAFMQALPRCVFLASPRHSSLAHRYREDANLATGRKPKPRIRGFRPLNKAIEINNSRFRLDRGRPARPFSNQTCDASSCKRAGETPAVPA